MEKVPQKIGESKHDKLDTEAASDQNESRISNPGNEPCARSLSLYI